MNETTTSTRDKASQRAMAALDAFWAADTEVTQAALHLLCLNVRHDYPLAVNMLLEWSDQGNHLSVVDVEDHDGTRVEWEGQEMAAANLCGRCEVEWLVYMNPGSRDTSRATFTLALQPTLDALTSR